MTTFSEIFTAPSIFVHQRKELAELIGFETRNKYTIDTADGQQIGFAAEQQKGFFGLLMRQFLGHWRRFEVLVFDEGRQPVFQCVHPFRFIFQEFIVSDHAGRRVGRLQQRFSILTKKFDVHDAQDQVTMTMSSPIWKIWTFPFKKNGIEVAAIKKRWGGILREGFTDADKFEVEFSDKSLTQDEKSTILCAAIFVDLQYFENKANTPSFAPDF